jgi:hypothetical protein
VPAIREFLAKNEDFDFGPGGGQMFVQSSSRAGDRRPADWQWA